jgi:two-component system NtrC family sensor kinase
VHSGDELGVLAGSFNAMTTQLAAAREELTGWTRTLEDRVAAKTGELRRAHEQMLQAEKMASIGKLAAVVAHEINNPLAGILTYTKLLRKWLQGGGWEAHCDEAHSSLQLIESESRRCGEIVRNLLMFARAAPLHMEATSLCSLVQRVIRLVKHQMDLSGVQAHLALPAEMPPVECDPSGIEQVLLALVMNAVEALPRGGNLWLAVRRVSPEEAQIAVRDDGCGMTPEVLSHIFDPFFTTKERGHGVGLGLAVTRTLVDRHRGRIEVQSEAGKGTSFIVTLPVRSTGAPEEESAPAAAAAPK